MWKVQSFDPASRLSRAVKIALPKIATKLNQKTALSFGLNPFCNDLHAKIAGHANKGMHDEPRLVIIVKGSDETAIDFDLIDRKISKM